VLEEKVDKGAAAVAGQLLNLNAYLRAVSVEMKAREQLELLERLQALEETLEGRKGAADGEPRAPGAPPRGGGRA
jgi:hypothetical protein